MQLHPKNFFLFFSKSLYNTNWSIKSHGALVFLNPFCTYSNSFLSWFKSIWQLSTMQLLVHSPLPPMGLGEKEEKVKLMG